MSCNFEYEYLPDFCFVCGIIGHVEKQCDVKLTKGEGTQYGKWLKWIMHMRERGDGMIGEIEATTGLA
jgi:hypothetical protein